jgi:hypothetical protein
MACAMGPLHATFSRVEAAPVTEYSDCSPRHVYVIDQERYSQDLPPAVTMPPFNWDPASSGNAVTTGLSRSLSPRRLAPATWRPTGAARPKQELRVPGLARRLQRVRAALRGPDEVDETPLSPSRHSLPITTWDADDFELPVSVSRSRMHKGGAYSQRRQQEPSRQGQAWHQQQPYEDELPGVSGAAASYAASVAASRTRTPGEQQTTAPPLVRSAALWEPRERKMQGSRATSSALVPMEEVSPRRELRRGAWASSDKETQARSDDSQRPPLLHMRSLPALQIASSALLHSDVLAGRSSYHSHLSPAAFNRSASVRSTPSSSPSPTRTAIGSSRHTSEWRVLDDLSDNASRSLLYPGVPSQPNAVARRTPMQSGATGGLPDSPPLSARVSPHRHSAVTVQSPTSWSPRRLTGESTDRDVGKEESRSGRMRPQLGSRTARRGGDMGLLRVGDDPDNAVASLSPMRPAWAAPVRSPLRRFDSDAPSVSSGSQAFQDSTSADAHGRDGNTRFLNSGGAHARQTLPLSQPSDASVSHHSPYRAVFGTVGRDRLNTLHEGESSSDAECGETVGSAVFPQDRLGSERRPSVGVISWDDDSLSRGVEVSSEPVPTAGARSMFDSPLSLLAAATDMKAAIHDLPRMRSRSEGGGVVLESVDVGELPTRQIVAQPPGAIVSSGVDDGIDDIVALLNSP